MLIENYNLISEESVYANTMNQYFTNITKVLKQHTPDLFTFNLVSSDEIKREILTLNNKKASSEGDIPVNFLKDATDTYLPTLTKVFNSSIEQNEFISELKLADAFPISKKRPS